jgi:hypothetical protein
MIHKTLKAVAGAVLGLACVAGVASAVLVFISLSGGHLGDMNESAAMILGASVGAILAAGVLWLLVEIADTLTAANDRKLRL